MDKIPNDFYFEKLKKAFKMFEILRLNIVFIFQTTWTNLKCL